MNRMFLDEQRARYLFQYRQDYHNEADILEKFVWSPLACRFTSWTYEQLVEFDHRGRVILRRRCPFITGG